MCDRPKIHVFLGAPPLSADPDAEPEAGVEEDGPPAGWTELEFTWRDGRLRPAAESNPPSKDFPHFSDEPENQASRNIADEGGANGSEAISQNLDHLTSPEAAQTATTKRGRDGLRFTSDGPNTEEEDRCSASLHEYLDSCFPAAQPEPEPEPELQLPPAIAPVSAHTHYLTTWTLSQALVLRGRHAVQSAFSTEKTPPKCTRMPPSVFFSSTPELLSPTTLSPGASAELFSDSCPTPRAEEGGIVLQATRDGVLCSQESPTESPTKFPSESPTKFPSESPTKSPTKFPSESPTKFPTKSPTKFPTESPTKSPSSKKVRLSDDCRTKTPESTVTTTGLRRPTTLLVWCNKVGVRYSVLVAVVHPCHLKEIKVRSGTSAGTLVPLASIVVTDQSGVEMKVVLWRRAAFWAVTVSPGDVLLITGLQVNEDRWRGETLLQSTFSSKLLNLGHITGSASPPVSQQVDARSLSSLCGFLRERRPLLVSLPRRPPQDLNRIPYATLRSLQVNTLVHALLRVTHTHLSSVWRSDCESLSRSGVQLKAVVTVEQADGQQGVLLLWGASVDWLHRFNTDRASLWDFHVLLVRDALTSDLPELHSTPWSSIRAVDPSDRRALDFRRARRDLKEVGGALELDVDTLLSQKYSGDVELRVHILSFHFQDALPSQNAPQMVLDGSSPPDAILEALSGDVTYTGCGSCAAELDTDANGIYCPCYPCLPHTAVRRYYRAAVLTVSGRSHTQVCVQVPPVPLQKMLEAPPDKLQRSSAPGSEVKNIQVAAERIRTLLSLPRKTFILTVRSRFLTDENSVPVHQDFTLLHLQSDKESTEG